MSTPDTRVLLLGLDGATFSILDPLIEQGVMPFLRSFMEGGARGILESTPHPLTPPAWTSMTTGRSPGNHGIFDFVRVEQRPDRPVYTLATSADIRCETLWSLASRQGRRVTALNFPVMFPAPQVDGFVVPGYVPWSYLSRAVHPRELYPRLRALPAFNAREVGTDWELERKAIQGLPGDELEGWVTFHIARERQWFEMLRWLMAEEPTELTAVVFDGVDRLQHLCWHLLDPAMEGAYTAPGERRVRELCLEYFRLLDGYLEQTVRAAGPDAHVLMASDHGFTPVGDRIFYANTWLQQNGYLAWAPEVPVDSRSRLALESHAETTALFDWDRTDAFALTSSSNGIFIRRTREAGEPGVSPDAYPAFRERLIRGLLDCRDPRNGQRVIRRVLTREEAFPGREMDKAPDLTLVMRDYSFLSVLRADSPLQPRLEPYGIHHPDGVLVAHGPGVAPGRTLAARSILDVTPTLLYLLGLPVPVDLEGAPVLEAFDPEHLARNPVVQGPPTRVPSGGAEEEEELVGAGVGPALPAAEEAQVLERLRALGYLA